MMNNWECLIAPQFPKRLRFGSGYIRRFLGPCKKSGAYVMRWASANLDIPAGERIVWVNQIKKARNARRWGY